MCIRDQLIEQHNLYGNIGSGTIVIKMKNGGKYTFESVSYTHLTLPTILLV
ncbi:hypothetical protein JMUB7528_28630 [Staphylococcus aureus]